MKTVWILLKNNIKILTVKSPMFTVLYILLPVVISVGISMLIPNMSSVSGVLIDRSGSPEAEALAKALQNNAVLEITVDEDVDVSDEIMLGNYDFGIVIKEDFATALETDKMDEAVEVYCGSSSGKIEIVEGTVGTELRSIRGISTLNSSDLTESLSDYLTGKTVIHSMNLDDTQHDYTAGNMLFSFLIMFAFLRAMTSAETIIKDRELGVYTRILITDTTPTQYYIANVISGVLLVAVQNGVSLFLIMLFSDIVLGGTVMETWIIILHLSFVAVTLGNFFVVSTDNKEISNILSTFVAIILLMAGIVPLEMLPKAAVFITDIIPTRWAVYCLEALQRGGTLAESVPYLLMMSVCSIILLAITLRIVRNKEYRAMTA